MPSSVGRSCGARVSHLIADVADYQLGHPDRADRSALPEATFRAAAVEALTWTVGMTAVLEPGTPT